jgi:hypothetical protein
MTDKPLKSLNGKKFEGVLAEPIDHGLFMPLLLDGENAGTGTTPWHRRRTV